MSVFSGLSRVAAVMATVGASVSLTACYVVPANQYPGPAVVTPAAPAPIVPLTFTARLYPSNDMAASFGMVTAVVTNDLNGRGNFSTNINGESFAGEATRAAGPSRNGVANGSGNRGSFLNCSYTMNSATLGTGSCRHSNGAMFTMHIGG